MQSNAIRIPETDIQDLYGKAEAYLATPTVKDQQQAKEPAAAGAFAYTPTVLSGPAAPTRKTSSGLSAALAVDLKSGGLLPPVRHAVVYNAMRAIAVGEAVGELFIEPLGYLDLAQRKKESRLVGPDVDRFTALVRAKSLVSLFVAASALGATCAATGTADTGDSDFDIDLTTTAEALKGFAGLLVKAVERVADTDLEAAVAGVTAKVMSWAEQQSHRAMGDLRAEFENKSYTVEADGFTVHGFERQGGARRAKSSEMQFKKPEEVIGNHVAKSQAMRLAKMLVSYDFASRTNPFVTLGGFTYTIMGDGNPGTGKTTLIQMVCGLIKDLCDVAGYPYYFENFDVAQISEYQGKSAQNTQAFIERVQDPKTIAFGTIDDIDQVAGRRDDKQSSSGAAEVTAVLMNAFAGSNTIIRGNCSYGMFSNYPDKVDDALRQRAVARWLVDGPQSRDDYIDIFYLLLGKNHAIGLGDHALFAAQALKKMAEKTYESFDRPSEPALVEVFDAFVSKHGKPKTMADVGSYLHAIKEKEPRFTGRAIANITAAIKNRSMDIELPDEWFSTPEAFMHKSLDEKVAMLTPLRRPITMDMVMQHINQYADSEFRYAGKSDEAEIAGMMRQLRLRSAVEKRVREGEGQ